jgi:hypothetical protein
MRPLEAGQVVDLAEWQEPRQPLVAFTRVVALELEERLFLRTAPVVRGAQIVDGELTEAQPERVRVW